MAYAPFEGCRVYSERLGDGSKTAIFGHGNLASCNSWRLMMPFLPLDRKNVFVDFPGFGKSDNIPPCTVEHCADALIAWQRHWGLEPAVYVGHSMGAVVGLAAALKGAQFSHMVLIGCGPADGYPMPEQMRASFAMLAQNPPLIEAMTRKNNGPFGLGEDILKEIIADAIRCIPHGYTEMADSLAGVRLSGQLSALPMPVTFLHGDHDSVVPLDWIRPTVAAAHGKLVVMEGQVHLPMLVEPEQFAATLEKEL
ncbi:MAG: alpha/beta hydrolase [Caldisericota bacterium]|nr:alpha/beta hydrolase [Caldisericota bacterium]